MKACKHCGKQLGQTRTKSQVFCSNGNRCRTLYHSAKKSADLVGMLVAMSEGRLREVLRDVMAQRQGRPGRFHLRYGAGLPK